MPPATSHRVLKDRRTKNLTSRLRSGDIALVHHADLDTIAARALIDCKVVAVVNAAHFITGRYPNRGPQLLLEAGISLVENVGDLAFDQTPDGQVAQLLGDTIKFKNGFCISGDLLTRESVLSQMEEAQKNLGIELDAFVQNTLVFVGQEKSLLFDPVEHPPLRTEFNGRHVLIVVRGEGYKEDLAMLRDYLSGSRRPVLLAVDGGADALLEVKLKPDLILGDMDSISDTALKCGAELLVHAYSASDRGAPGLERIEKLGLHAHLFPSPGTSEDAAMLLADSLGASLIVAVGTHFSLEEFLDKGRRGMASTFLTRLKIGSKLVDAKGIARLYAQQKPRLGELTLLLALPLFAAATCIFSVLLLSPMGQNALRLARVWFSMRSK